MKPLSELNARFYGSGSRAGLGITFECPVHHDHRLAVPFANPLDGGPGEVEPGKPAWKRTGDTIQTLTLTPSVDVR